MMKFYQISGKSMSRKQKALYNFLLDKLKEYQEILIVGLDNKDEKYTPTLNVINGDEFLSLNQNGLAICNVYPEDELYEYEVVTFYDTSDAQENGEGLVYQISRHTSGQSTDELGSSTWFTISQEGKLVQTDHQLSLFQSRRTIKSSADLYDFTYEDENGFDRHAFYAEENNGSFEVTDRDPQYKEVRIGDIITVADAKDMGLEWKEVLASSRKPIKSSQGSDDYWTPEYMGMNIDYQNQLSEEYKNSNRVYQYGFDYIITNGDTASDVENRIEKELNSIYDIELVGNPGINNISWTVEEYWYGLKNIETSDGLVHQYTFDYIITNGNTASDVENSIENELNSIDGIEVVGNPGINNTSWSKEEYGITSSFRSHKPIKSSVSKQRVKEELDYTYYNIENPERFYDIQFDINWEDIAAFATSWNKCIDIDPREIVSVEYDDSVPSSYQDVYNMDYDAIDGAYIVKFKDGTSKSYGWTYGGDKLIPMTSVQSSRKFEDSYCTARRNIININKLFR